MKTPLSLKFILLLISALLFAANAQALSKRYIYDDQLVFGANNFLFTGDGLQNNSSVSFTSPKAFIGSHSIVIKTLQDAGFGTHWKLMLFANGNSAAFPGVNISGYTHIEFKARANKNIRLQGAFGSAEDSAAKGFEPVELSSTWKKVSLDISDKNLADINSLLWLYVHKSLNPLNFSGLEVYLDEVALVDKRGAVNLSGNLVGHWPLLSSHAGQVADLTVLQNFGTLRGNATVSPSHGAVILNGGDDAVEIPGLHAYNFNQSFTLTAWVNPADLNGGQTIINKWYAPDSYLLSIRGGKFEVMIAINDGQPFGTQIAIDTPATAQRWSQVTATWGASVLKLYVDGELKAQRTVNGQLQQSDRPLVIGNHPQWSAYRGLIRQVQMFDRELSASEVKQLFILD